MLGLYFLFRDSHIQCQSNSVDIKVSFFGGGFGFPLWASTKQIEKSKIIAIIIVVDLFIMVKVAKSRFFKMVKVNPCDQDYDFMLRVCERVNARLMYRTVKEVFGRVRLFVYVIFRNRREYTLSDVAKMFPNFLPVLEVGTAASDWIWVSSSSRLPSSKPCEVVDSGVYTNGKDHPLESVRARLF